MAVIGGHQLDIQLTPQFHQTVIGDPLFGNVVFLDFKVEPVTEDLLQLPGLVPGRIHTVMGDQPGDFTVQAGSEGKQPLLVFVKQLLVNARLVIKPLGLGNGSQLHQVPVAGFIHGQQHDMKVMSCCLIMDQVAFPGNIKLTTNQGINPCFFCLGVKFKRPVHGPVIGNSHTLHVVFQGLADQVIKADCSVKHGVLGMDVQVCKRCRHG